MSQVAYGGAADTLSVERARIIIARDAACSGWWARRIALVCEGGSNIGICTAGNEDGRVNPSLHRGDSPC